MNDRGGARQRLLTIRVRPGSRETRIEKFGEAEYRVHVPAAPQKGAANRQVVAALAEYFGLPASRVRIVRGERSRIKLVALNPEG
jgi:uncharacterized protein (TIGR00251 family)